MIEFAYPLCFILLVLPFVARLLFKSYKENKASVQVPYFYRLVHISGKTPTKGAVLLESNRLQKILVIFGWIVLVTALAKPEWVGAPIEQKKSAREIMVALDLSNSMSEKGLHALHLVTLS